jgi:beta-glucan synthesis-associated protein KRE6
LTGNQYEVYGVQYQPGFDGGVRRVLCFERTLLMYHQQYIAWIANGKLAWELKQAGMAADTRVEIGPRPVPQEPMVCLHPSEIKYIITHLVAFLS